MVGTFKNPIIKELLDVPHQLASLLDFIGIFRLSPMHVWHIVPKWTLLSETLEHFALKKTYNVQTTALFRLFSRLSVTLATWFPSQKLAWCHREYRILCHILNSQPKTFVQYLTACHWSKLHSIRRYSIYPNIRYSLNIPSLDPIMFKPITGQKYAHHERTFLSKSLL